MMLIFLLYNIVKYYNGKIYQKNCNTYYIALSKPDYFKGYEKKDNLSFLKYKIK